MSLFKLPPKIELTDKQLDDIATWIGVTIDGMTIGERVKYGHDVPRDIIMGQICSDWGQLKILYEFMEVGFLELHNNEDNTTCVKFKPRDSNVSAIECKNKSVGNALLACAIEFLEVKNE